MSEQRNLLSVEQWVELSEKYAEAIAEGNNGFAEFNGHDDLRKKLNGLVDFEVTVCNARKFAAMKNVPVGRRRVKSRLPREAKVRFDYLEERLDALERRTAYLEGELGIERTKQPPL